MFQVKAISTIFFDLDNTLFHHTRAEQEALRTVRRNSPALQVHSEDDFLKTYHARNSELWQRMADGEIGPEALKVERFRLTLESLQSNHANPRELSEKYLRIYAAQAFMLPYAREALDYLHPRYRLGILSNGFVELQKKKLQNTSLAKYFQFEIYSENVGALKPSQAMFKAAEVASATAAGEVLYIGDSYEADVVGAKNAGWSVIHLNPAQPAREASVADAEIRDLKELFDLL